MSFPLIASKKVTRFLVDSLRFRLPFDDVVFFAPSLPIEESLSFGLVVSNLPHPLNERIKPILKLD